MKYLVYALIGMFTYTAAYAQTAGSASQSQAQSGAISGAAAGANLQVTNQYSSGKSELKHSGDFGNTPAVAPASIVGGHPCMMSDGSFGLAIPGYGASVANGRAEPVCMLMALGQTEAAIRALVMTDNTACKALANVGYYQVGTRVIPFSCGDTVAGGIHTKGSGARTVSSKSEVKSLYKKCSFDQASNTVTWKPRYGADRTASKAQCMTALGF